MKKLQFSVLPIGNHAPNLRGFSNSCYLIQSVGIPLVLDLGYKTFNRLMLQIKSMKLDISKMVIIISHGHFDHCVDLIKLGGYLKSNKISGVKLFIPEDNKWYKIIKKLYSRQFDIININERTVYRVGNLKLTFSKTDHCNNKLSSYAIKLKMADKTIVYTSDICSVDKNLENFVKNVDNVIVDSGNPYHRIHLKGYHGNTYQITSKLSSLNVKNIYITHLKGGMNDEIYLDNAIGNCYIVKEGISIQVINTVYYESKVAKDDELANEELLVNI